MKNHLVLPLVFIAVAALAGCATLPASDSPLAQARTAYAGAQANPQVTSLAAGELKQAGDSRATPKNLEAEHPLVRTHPETGRKALYTSVAHTARIKGWTEKESLPLLQFLWDHQTRPEFTCRFQWKVGSLAFWDNRCAMHNPINDYHGFRRVMHRITLAGDKPE